MAKVTSVNINTFNAAIPGSDIGYGISGLMTLLLANGWTLVSCSPGIAPGRRTPPSLPLSLSEWTTNTNQWQIVNRGSIWVAMRRVSATSLDVRYAVAAPTGLGTITTPDTFAAGTEQTFLGLPITLANRAHAITYDTDENAAGIRPFYLLFTDGTNTMRGTVVLEAMANGSYASANAYPYVVTAGGNTGGATPLQSNSTQWAWYYSPSSIWVPTNTYSTLGDLFGTTTSVGVDPWNSKDPAYPISWGRRSALTSPGFVGTAKYIKGAGVLRGYPNTVDTATDAYVYANQCLVPFANNTIPL